MQWLHQSKNCKLTTPKTELVPHSQDSESYIRELIFSNCCALTKHSQVLCSVQSHVEKETEFESLDVEVVTVLSINFSVELQKNWEILTK